MAVRFLEDANYLDSVQLQVGSSSDLTLVHDGSNSYIHHNGAGSLFMKADTGNINIINYTNDADIILQSDDGAGGVTPYLTLDGSTTHAHFSNPGNVGIGTSSPAKTLDVNGDTNITGYLDLKVSSPTGSPLLRFYQSTTRRGFIQMADTNNNLRVASEYGSVSLEAAATSGVDSDTSYIRINPGGTVEIGAVDGDATITTDGNMTFRIDADNDETSQSFRFQSNNPATEVASISDTGALDITTIELGDPSDTTLARASAGKVTIEGAPIQTTQMSVSYHNFYFNTTSTTVDYFIPFNNLNEGSNPTSTAYYTRKVAPFDGKLNRVTVHTTAAIGTNCTLQFWIASATDTFTSYTEQVTGINLNTAYSSATAVFSSATFSEGDVLGVSIIKSGTTSTAYIQLSAVWEYTV